MKQLTGLLLAGHSMVAVLLLLISIMLWPPRMGVDLGGGVRFVYAVDRSEFLTGTEPHAAPDVIDWRSLTRALRDRVDPSGAKDVVVQPDGDGQVEIVIPTRDPAEHQAVKRRIAATGSLEFRILANARDHHEIVTLAEEQAQNPDLARRIDKFVMNRNAEKLGRWVQAAKKWLLVTELEGHVLRNSATGEMVNCQSLGPVRSDEQSLDSYLAENGLENVDVLVATNDGCDVTGDLLEKVAASIDEHLNPCVNFELRGEGAEKFRLLTSSNLPDTDSSPPFYRHLGIILNEQLISFPRLITTIGQSGRITGSFTLDDVEFLVAVLRAGRLPVQLGEIPVSESEVRSNRAISRYAAQVVGISLLTLAAIWLMMVLRYGLIGLAASLANLLQILSTLALVELVHATVTLPMVIGAAAMSLFSGVGLLLICASVQRAERVAANVPGSIWHGLIISAAPFTVVLVVVFFAGNAAYLLGDFAVRSAAIPVVIGSAVTFLTLGTCVLLPIVMLANESWARAVRDMPV